MAAAAQCAAPTTQRYQRRRPERTLWYRIVQTNLETWLELATGPSGESPPAYVERSFRRYLECGILAHGFARAYRDKCQHDFPSAESSWHYYQIPAPVQRVQLERTMKFWRRLASAEFPGSHAMAWPRRRNSLSCL